MPHSRTASLQLDSTGIAAKLADARRSSSWAARSGRSWRRGFPSTGATRQQCERTKTASDRRSNLWRSAGKSVGPRAANCSCWDNRQSRLWEPLAEKLRAKFAVGLLSRSTIRVNACEAHARGVHWLKRTYAYAGSRFAATSPSRSSKSCPNVRRGIDSASAMLVQRRANPMQRSISQRVMIYFRLRLDHRPLQLPSISHAVVCDVKSMSDEMTALGPRNRSNRGGHGSSGQPRVKLADRTGRSPSLDAPDTCGGPTLRQACRNRGGGRRSVADRLHPSTRRPGENDHAGRAPTGTAFGQACRILAAGRARVPRRRQRAGVMAMPRPGNRARELRSAWPLPRRRSGIWWHAARAGDVARDSAR